MAKTALKKPKKTKKPTRIVDWVNPHPEYVVTMEEYRNEMRTSETSGLIRFEDHKKNMKEWMERKLQ